jgi:hypothetical protein
MPTDETMRAIGKLVESMYAGCDEIGRDEIYRRVEASDVAPEVKTYFAHLPDGDYTLDELVDEISGEVQEAEATGDLGLLG